MRVMVTGGAGRIGRAVVAALRGRHEVVLFDLQPQQDDPGGGVETVLGNVHDLGEVASALRGADAVIHLARATSNHNRLVVFRSNLMGTYHVLEAAAACRVPRVLVASSINALGPVAGLRVMPDYLPLDEAHPAAPQGAYSLAKYLVEQACAAYTREQGMLTVAVRPTLVIGPEEYGTRVRDRLGDEVRFGLRAYVDSRDVAQLFVRALEQLEGGHHLYFANGPDAMSRTPLADLLPRQFPELGGKAAALTDTTPAVSTAKATRELGYEPVYSWRQVLDTS